MSAQNLRLLFFIGGLILFASLEVWFSYRSRNMKRLQRWPANLSMLIIANLIIKVFLPLGLVFFAQTAQEWQWGLLNQFNFNTSTNLMISLISLDLAIYWQHVLFHKVPFLWRIHRVHHADIDLDATSALRFHPLEILLSLIYKGIWVICLGLPVFAVVVFEIILNFIAMFNHSNIKLPTKLESYLRLFLVTPQMHIIHHSIYKNQSDKNYGFNMSWWDFLFKTYQKDFLKDKKIGQNYYRSAKDHKLWRILILPFKDRSLNKQK